MEKKSCFFSKFLPLIPACMKRIPVATVQGEFFMQFSYHGTGGPGMIPRAGTPGARIIPDGIASASGLPAGILFPKSAYTMGGVAA
jgi:hypothetical protein